MGPRILPHSARRLRDEPIDVASAVVEQFGKRGATTLGEAQAAAYFDGRLRRAGLKVSADAFQSSTGVGWDGVALALFFLLGVIVYRWFPVLGVAVAACGFLGALWLVFGVRSVWLAKRGASQNIVGTRALVQRAKCRVVLLAPIDAPAQFPPLLRKYGVGEIAGLMRIALCMVILGAALAGMLAVPFELRLFCWYVQCFAAVLLCAMGGLDIGVGRAAYSPGAANHAGALAVLLACAEELVSAEHIELWTVGVGASATGQGLRDLLRRYPFERESTVFVTLESLGRGELAYITRAGGAVVLPSTPTLVEMIADVERADPLINASPRAVRFVPTMLSMLRREGWQALGLMCLDADGFPCAYARADDVPSFLDGDVLDRAIRLVLGLVRRIDETCV